MKVSETERQQAIKDLRKLLKPGSTVFTVLRHVSSSGMFRVIDVIVLRNNEPRNIAYAVSRVLGWPLHTIGEFEITCRAANTV